MMMMMMDEDEDEDDDDDDDDDDDKGCERLERDCFLPCRADLDLPGPALLIPFISLLNGGRCL